MGVCVMLHMRLPDLLDLPIPEVRLYIQYLDKYPENWRIELAMAMNTATLANINRDKKTKKSPFRLSDFSSVAAKLSPEKTEREKADNLLDWMTEHAKSDGDTENAKKNEGGAEDTSV